MCRRPCRRALYRNSAGEKKNPRLASFATRPKALRHRDLSNRRSKWVAHSKQWLPGPCWKKIYRHPRSRASLCQFSIRLIQAETTHRGESAPAIKRTGECKAQQRMRCEMESQGCSESLFPDFPSPNALGSSRFSLATVDSSPQVPPAAAPSPTIRNELRLIVTVKG